MHVNMEQGELLRGLEHTLGVVDRKGHMPILAHCLMEANGRGLVISATDLEISFRGSFPAEVRKPGTFAVRAHTLHSLVKGLPKTDLEITGDENHIELINVNYFFPSTTIIFPVASSVMLLGSASRRPAESGCGLAAPRACRAGRSRPASMLITPFRPRLAGPGGGNDNYFCWQRQPSSLLIPGPS